MTKKKIKLTGGNGGKAKVNNEMGPAEAEIRAKAKIHIHVYISKTGEVDIWGPTEHPDVFRETLFQAAHIMEEKWKKEGLTKAPEKENKVVELHPKIVIAQK